MPYVRIVDGKVRGVSSEPVDTYVYVNDETFKLHQEHGDAWPWDGSTFAPQAQETITVSDEQIISYKIDQLWNAAHEYEFNRISGSAIGLLTIGVLKQLPRSLAVTAWLKSIWNLYYERKAQITPTSDISIDFSVCGEMPYSIPEIREELGL